MKHKPVAATPALPTPTLSAGLRRYLYITAAVTGGVIMIVEILGAKMLSPYLGTSHFVWTAQIAVTLVALACGYFAGGWLVDRALRLGRMYAAIMVAGVYLAVTIPLRKPVAYACLGTNLAIGSLLASAFLFFVPLALLAMVGPFVIRVLTVSMNGLGGNIGRLSSISTLGSFVGTVLIGYVLIPFLPNSLTMYITALLLLTIGACYFLLWGRGPKVKPSSIAMVAVGALIGWFGMRGDQWTGKEHEELFRGNSNFGELQVLESIDATRRYYLNDFLTQNTYDTEGKKSASMFTFMLHLLAKAYTPRTDEVLCIGLGVGIVPMEFAREGSRVDVIEINPAVVPVGRRFFNLEPEKLNITFGDGRWFVNRCRKQYDAVVLDAFLGDSSPSHLMTREAFTSIRRILKPQGVLVINSFGDFEQGHDFFTASLFKTLADVFPGVKIHAGRTGNTMFVAGMKPDLAFVNPPDFSNVANDFVGSLVREAFNNLRAVDPASGRILTDDYNPVEFYDAANRERLRRALAIDVRSL